MKILLAEDDDNLGALLYDYLRLKGYEVMWCKNGKKALVAFKEGQFELCILDVKMPEMDGFTLAVEVKKLNPEIPLIFLTVNALKDDVIKGFHLGADDYITKPFNMEELLLRIRAVSRRIPNTSGNGPILLGNIYFEPEKQMIEVNGEHKKISTKESELLLLFCLNKGKMLERQFILKKIWGNDDYFCGRSMDVYVAKLRKLLKNEPSLEIISVHGKGYRLTVGGN